MSVLKRFRTVSEYQPLTDAKDLRGQLMNWALNENNIPKKKRVLFLEDLKNICNSLVHNIKEAIDNVAASSSTITVDETNELIVVN